MTSSPECRLSLLFLLICCTSAGANVIRSTESGKVRGLKTNLAQVFYGIRYAAPAVRWEPAKNPLTHEGVYEATSPGPMCYQGPCTSNNPLSSCITERSEDCLFLNIFAPLSAKPDDKKPVMVYIHGGYFIRGTAAGGLYNAEKLAQLGDVIVVSMNYRLGMFSFLVTGNGDGDITGNYGIRDQRQALKWVRRNIEQFGGDKDQVTLIGQSAGAVSTYVHLISRKSDKYFNKVILLSSPNSIPLKPLEVAVNDTNFVTLALNCSIGDTQCLRSKSPDDIVAAQSLYLKQTIISGFPDSYLRRYFPFIPHIDGKHVPHGLMDAAETISYCRKPVIWASTSEEGLFFIYGAFEEPMSSIVYQFLVNLAQAAIAPQVLSLYPSTVGDNRDTLSQLTTDLLFQCPNRFLAQNQSSNVPTYLSSFDASLSFAFWGVAECLTRTCHTVDVPYIFQSARTPPQKFTRKEKALSTRVICHYSNFARTGNPNKPKNCGGPFWPRANTVDDNMMIYRKKKSTVATNVRRRYCNFWDENSDYRE